MTETLGDPDTPPGPEHEANPRSVRICNGDSRCFSEKGFQATTIIDIGDAAGVSRPLVYKYFGDKDGRPKDESRFLLEFLASRVNDVSIQCRMRWTKGAVAIWDERCTQHSGAADHRGQPRTLRRCTIAGKRPE